MSALSGRAVLQRHEASAIDLANAEGDTKRVVSASSASPSPVRQVILHTQLKAKQ